MADTTTSEISKQIMATMKELGVADLKTTYGIKAASLFAKALVIERNNGKTTPEALDLLDQAIAAIDAAQATK